MLNIIVIIGIIVLVLILVFLLVWHFRTRNFKPTENKLIQQRQLNADLDFSGFAYQIQGDYFYSLMNCWQREMGYCKLYDDGAAFFNMIMDCEPVSFSYGGKRWLIELWKGQYGITTGAEIGVYNTVKEDINTDRFEGTFYEQVKDDELLQMEFVLRKNGKVILKREGYHWWLTGFKLGEFSSPESLTMDAAITFPNYEMCRAFANELRNLGYRKHEYSIRRNRVKIHYTKPHTPKSITRNMVQETIAQQENEKNCMLYNAVTGKYSDTLDKIEYLKTAMPELYDIFIHSLYARGLYEAFDWIIKIIAHKPKPEPVPPPKPEPCPPRPCPPPKPEPCPPRPCPPPYPGLCPPHCNRHCCNENPCSCQNHYFGNRISEQEKMYLRYEQEKGLFNEENELEEMGEADWEKTTNEINFGAEMEEKR